MTDGPDFTTGSTLHTGSSTVQYVHTYIHTHCFHTHCHMPCPGLSIGHLSPECFTSSGHLRYRPLAPKVFTATAYRVNPIIDGKPGAETQDPIWYVSFSFLVLTIDTAQHLVTQCDHTLGYQGMECR
jgi:hypothetical protein